MSGEYRSQAEDAGTIVAVWRRLGSAWSLHPERNTAIVLGLLTMFWLLELLIPTFEQIAPHDDTAYIRSGHWLVADGALRVYVWGPLLSALYGLAYVVVQESVNWFVWTATGGRLATYGLFCTGVYLCARALSPRPAAAHAALVIGLTWPLAASFVAVWNSSDHLFMAMSALALSQLLAYLSDRSAKHLVWGSVLVGLAALTRPDGLILVVSFVLLSLATDARDAKALLPPGWAKRLSAAFAPAVFIVGGYLVLYGIVTGSWGMGVMSRTYQAFEQGHGVIYRERYSGNALVEGYGDVRSLFGTAAENDRSVFRAIVRNPSAFFDRTVRALGQMPRKVDAAFGGPLAIALLFLVSRGVLSLWRARQGWTLAVLLGWHLHLLSYFLTFWRPGYLRFSFVALALLAGVGASAAAGNWRDWRERAAVAVALAGLAGWLLWDGGGRIWGDPVAREVPVTIVLLLGMALWVPTLTPGCQRRPEGKLLSLLAGVTMVCGVATAAGRSPIDRLPPNVGGSAEERAVAVAAEELPPGVPIASLGVKLPVAARRPSRTLGYLMTRPVLESALEEWQAGSDAGAIYLSPFMQRQYGSWFEFLVERLGRDPRWVSAFSDEESHAWLFANRSLLEVDGVWRSHEPVLRSGFDVFVLDGLLVYVKEACDQEDATRRFFVHGVPVDPDVLPEPQRARGIAHLSFRAEHNLFRVDDRCIATRMLPGYDMDYIVTGQYLPGKERYWQGRIDFGGGRESLR